MNASTYLEAEGCFSPQAFFFQPQPGTGPLVLSMYVSVWSAWREILYSEFEL